MANILNIDKCNSTIKTSEYTKELRQSKTIDQPMATRVRDSIQFQATIGPPAKRHTNGDWLESGGTLYSLCLLGWMDYTSVS